MNPHLLTLYYGINFACGLSGLVVVALLRRPYKFLELKTFFWFYIAIFLVCITAGMASYSTVTGGSPELKSWIQGLRQLATYMVMICVPFFVTRFYELAHTKWIRWVIGLLIMVTLSETLVLMGRLLFVGFL